jgi:hypothetical protein
MTEIKFLHKVLIFIVVAWVGLKVSSMKFSKFLQHKPALKDVPPKREPEKDHRAPQDVSEGIGEDPSPAPATSSEGVCKMNIDIRFRDLVLVAAFILAAFAVVHIMQPVAVPVTATPTPAPTPEWYNTPPSWYSNPPVVSAVQPARVVYTNTYNNPTYYGNNPALLLYMLDDYYNMVRDYSGNGYDGTLHGAYLTGDRSARFSGEDFISFDTPVISAPPYSIEAWINPDNTWVSENQYILANGGEKRNGYGFAMYLSSGSNGYQGLCFQTRSPDGNGAIACSSPGYSGWMHVIGTWDDNIARLYVNGNLVDTTYATSVATGSAWNLMMGSDAGEVAFTYHGSIGKVAIYPYVLSSDGVRNLYDDGRK